MCSSRRFSSKEMQKETNKEGGLRCATHKLKTLLKLRDFEGTHDLSDCVWISWFCWVFVLLRYSVNSSTNIEFTKAFDHVFTLGQHGKHFVHTQHVYLLCVTFVAISAFCYAFTCACTEVLMCICVTYITESKHFLFFMSISGLVYSLEACEGTHKLYNTIKLSPQIQEISKMW